MEKAFLVIDMQNSLSEIPESKNVIDEINKRIEFYRNSNNEIIFIQHIDSEMPFNSYNWQLINSINNKDDDTYLTKKYPDAFFDTDLKEYLDNNNIKNIEICGA
ncbi:isochorismatase family protein [Convivina praedatoris]|uniref:Isochorismatase-like domain-containing protein n=1 Tax=Convivina praedatoris TaxID=2880963 RepID=A0ABM9D2Y9_9LACO|nr:isochorismatase family protein [Convivina sp. LMG 32447]CAH1855899.1 hypothetical protein R077815_01304 [Convivina sp. LMG 32447]CAH1856607.1 hypothetical protein LMG032447_01326 [Convivina sp. LMG 32447]CAH1856867.1 hypothetical protein R078138_01457 [Convivina sp. LMG 32447]